MKHKKYEWDCETLENHRLGWAYLSLVYLRDLEHAMHKCSVASEYMPPRTVEKIFIGSSISISCFLNILEPLHGNHACKVGEEQCLIVWTRELLNRCGIPDLNDR